MKHDARGALFLYAGILVVALLLAHLGDVAFFCRAYDVPRLRVVAHSDAPYDQWVKGEVARIALRWWKEVAAEEGRHVRSASAFRISPGEPGTISDLSGEDLEVLRQAVRTWLAERGVPYGFRIEVGKVEQPPRTYGGHLLAAGEAPTVLITLGEGKGHNFWTLLFPHLAPKGAYLQESPARTGSPAPNPEDLPYGRDEGSVGETERYSPERVDQLAFTGGTETPPLSPSGSGRQAPVRQEGKFAWHLYVWDRVHVLWERAFFR
ncbi:MAG: hypothetical protein BLITH_0429 [Brockia lithotrophica]|uniref:Stage II sporulation protein R n=1 Tax=Brockia lithotrophica TaxID=933949 RepID=A0A2T5GAX6_9BACL|nr:stage II sporulation protein R [Brockia lithotrophica]PTQ53349.1 MAG: hypothetical protein BLITH_0429 [Brockia lithotrophica]